MLRKVLVDRTQLIKALGTLTDENGQVDLTDVIGVIDNCNSWITNKEQTEIAPIPSKSVLRRVIIQLDN